MGVTLMKMLITAFCICLLPAVVSAQDASKSVLLIAPEMFDQWGDLRPADENTHLNKLAAQAKEWPLSIIHLFVYAGQTACIGEAKARGIRAKNYLVRQGLASNRITLTDAGWREEAGVEVWIWPPELGKPKVDADLNLKPGEVKLEKGCKIKYRS
jgi:hypothetical protein